MDTPENAKPVIGSRHGAVAIVQMNRPDRLNVQSIDLLECLDRELQAAAGNSDIRAVVLSGAGRSFSAGGDLSLFRADLARAPEVARNMVGQFHACVRTIQSMAQPVIAALHGPIAGGGFSLAIACDLAVAADDTTFLSAYTRLGTNPDGGGTWSLTHILGARRALEVMLLNETIDAAKALELGLVNRVVPAAVLEESALELATEIAEGPALAIASVKRLVRQASTATLDEQLDQEKASFVAAAGTADFREGVAAFFERRPARFNAP